MCRRDLPVLLAVAALLVTSVIFSTSAANEQQRPVSCADEQPRRTTARKLPAYPGAESVGWESTSLEGGGGGFGEVQATSDDPEAVARWLACRIGDPTTVDSSWSWHRRSESADSRSSTVIEVQPYDHGRVPHFATRVPKGTRTVIEVHSFVTPLED